MCFSSISLLISSFFFFFGVSITFLPYDEIHIAIAAIRFHSLSRAASWPVQFIVVVAVAVCHLRIWFLLRQTFLLPGFLSQVDCCCYWKLWNHHVMIILPLWFAIVFAFVFVFFSQSNCLTMCIVVSGCTSLHLYSVFKIHFTFCNGALNVRYVVWTRGKSQV